MFTIEILIVLVDNCSTTRSLPYAVKRTVKIEGKDQKKLEGRLPTNPPGKDIVFFPQPTNPLFKLLCRNMSYLVTKNHRTRWRLIGWRTRLKLPVLNFKAKMSNWLIEFRRPIFSFNSTQGQQSPSNFSTINIVIWRQKKLDLEAMKSITH